MGVEKQVGRGKARGRKRAQAGVLPPPFSPVASSGRRGCHEQSRTHSR